MHGTKRIGSTLPNSNRSWLSFHFKISLIVFLISINAESARFSNAYIAFEMQDNWKCNLEQTEWVCRSSDPNESKEAVIVLTAKEKGPTDTFPIYEGHLNGPINTSTKSGMSLTSKIKYKASYLKIGSHNWIDGLHQDSEVQNYFTRYLATIKDNVAILVTFSAHNKVFSKHSENFNKTIQSLQILATKDLVNREASGPKGGVDIYGNPTGNGGSGMGGVDAIEDEPTEGDGGLLANPMFWGIALLLLAIIGFIGFKIYQKNKNM